MSKKKSREAIKKIKILSVFFIAIAVILVLLLVYKIIINKGDYYKLDSRIDKINNSVEFQNSSYETMGWLRVQGTNLDLPIVRSDMEEGFPVELESFGWSENSDNKFHNNIRINGHNIFNLSKHPKLKSDLFQRFEELMNFMYYDFAKNNKYIQLTIDGKDYIYKIFSTGLVSPTEKTLFPHSDDIDKDDFKEYKERLDKLNFYNYDVDVNENDKLITLSTCTRFYGADNKYEFYVTARLLREDEKIDNYKVTKGSNYKKVEEVLKGDDDNEESNA